MQEVGQGVDDGNRAAGGETLDFAVRVGAHDQAVHEAREDAGGVFHGFAAPELDVTFVEKKRVAAEFVHADFKGNAGARGGFGENQGPGLILEDSRVADVPRFCLRSRAKANTSAASCGVKSVSLRKCFIKGSDHA